MNNKKLHILFLPAWYPFDDDSMSGLFVQNHARAVARFQKVTVIHAQAKENLSEKFRLDVSEKNGFPEILIYYRKVTGKFPIFTPFRKIYRLWQAIRKGVKYMKEQYGKPNLIHAHILTRYGMFAYFLSKRWKIPFVITEHWSRYLPVRNEFKGWLRKIVTRKIVNKASYVMPVSENLAKAMQSHNLTNSKILIVPNVVDIDMFINSVAEKDKKIFHFIHISCIDNESKNITGILDAVNLLLNERTDFDLSIVGDGPDLQMVKEYSEKLKLQNKVFFKGLLSGKKLVDEIQKSHCSIVFSNFETFSIVAIESLACSVPVIATRVGAIPEFISNKRGILINTGDIQSLKNAMTQMMGSYKQFDLSAIRQYAIDNFSFQKVGKQLSQIYIEAVSNV